MSCEYYGMGDDSLLNTIDSIGGAGSPALGWAKVGADTLTSISGIVQGVQKLKAVREQLAAQKDVLAAQIKIREIDLEIARLAVEAAKLGYADAASLKTPSNVASSQTVKNIAIGGGAAALGLLLMSK